MRQSYEYFGIGTYDGATAMALTQTMLERTARTKIPSLGFSASQSPSIILGQGEALDSVKPAGMYGLVRRMSPGTHIAYDPNVLAYTVTYPRDGTFTSHRDFRSHVAGKIAEGIASLGISNVEADNDAATIVVDNHVVAGHAIVIGSESLLLHGVLAIAKYDAESIAQRIWLQERDIDGVTYAESDALRTLPSIAELLQTSISPVRVRRKVASVIADTLTHGHLHAARVDEEMKQRTNRLLAAKYRNDAWTLKRDVRLVESWLEELPGEELRAPLVRGQPYCLYSQVPDAQFRRMTKPRAMPLPSS